MESNPHVSSPLACGQMSRPAAQVLHKTTLQAEQTLPGALTLLQQPLHKTIVYDFDLSQFRWDLIAFENGNFITATVKQSDNGLS